MTDEVFGAAGPLNPVEGPLNPVPTYPDNRGINQPAGVRPLNRVYPDNRLGEQPNDNSDLVTTNPSIGGASFDHRYFNADGTRLGSDRGLEDAPDAALYSHRTRLEISEDLANTHALAPQRAQLAKIAIDQIYAGIDELAKLGRTFDLFEVKPGYGKVPDEYPKMLYHDSKGQTTVSGRDEENRLGPGWRLTPSSIPQVPPVVPEAFPTRATETNLDGKPILSPQTETDSSRPLDVGQPDTMRPLSPADPVKPAATTPLNINPATNDLID